MNGTFRRFNQPGAADSLLTVSEEVSEHTEAPCRVILDLDGTVYSAGTSFGRELDAQVEAFLLRRSGWSLKRLLALEEAEPSVLGALDLLGISRDEWTRAVYAELPYDRLQPDPQLRALLVERFLERVVVTLSPAAHARRVLDRLGLGDVVDAVYSVCDLGGTTKHDVYAKIVGRQGRPAEILVVGDHPILDLVPAAELGCVCRLVSQKAGDDFFSRYPSVVEALVI